MGALEEESGTVDVFYIVAIEAGEGGSWRGEEVAKRGWEKRRFMHGELAE